jgi:hypothetical protein
MLIIFLINIYYNISKLFNCTTPNMHVYDAHNTYCTSICDSILIKRATNGSWGLIHGMNIIFKAFT